MTDDLDKLYKLENGVRSGRLTVAGIKRQLNRLAKEGVSFQYCGSLVNAVSQAILSNLYPPELFRLLLECGVPVFELDDDLAIIHAAFQPENRGIYTQSDSPKKSSRNIWSLAVVSVDQRY